MNYGTEALIMAGILGLIWLGAMAHEWIRQRVDEAEPDEHEIFPGF